MKVYLPLMIDDPMTSRYQGMRLKEGFYTDQEDFYLHGPACRRVAVLDFDPAGGVLYPGVRFHSPAEGRKLGRYGIPDEDDIYSPEFMQASVFATVLKTMYMFEDADTLGRRLTWAFEAPQLLVVPRAGNWVNAYYERESHSLQFFFFAPPHDPSRMVFTCLSRDIVAHEAGHAILDGVARDLYNAITPQSLALHEGIADLTALLMAFSSHSLRKIVLDQTDGSIENSTAFSSLAEEFGRALDPQGRVGYLRQLLNQKTLDPDDDSLDADGRPNRVARDEPHELSQVLTGALYTVMVLLHEDLKQKYVRQSGRTEFQVSGRALGVAARRFKSMIFRALDYLPPGEIAFSDYARAIIAADQAAYPNDDRYRRRLAAEFVRRRIVDDISALHVETDFADPALKDVDLQTLVESDWAAYEFARQNRKLLAIPPDVAIRVRPRLDVTKTYYYHDGPRQIRECLFKVSWDHQEPNPLGPRYPRRRQITLGSTLAIDWETRRGRARLATMPDEECRADRDRMLLWLVDADMLRVGRRAIGPEGRHLRSVVRAEAMGEDLMRLRATARTLHIARK